MEMEPRGQQEYLPFQNTVQGAISKKWLQQKILKQQKIIWLIFQVIFKNPKQIRKDLSFYLIFYLNAFRELLFYK